MSNDILLLLQFLSVRGTPPGVSTDLFSQLPNEHVRNGHLLLWKEDLISSSFLNPKDRE